MTSRPLLVVLCLPSLIAIACADPVHDAAVEALGGEQPGVRKGPDHRPGQPCLTCHGGEGPASFQMAFGGTVYAHASGDAPVQDATVIVADAKGRTFQTTTNCAGNFWVPAKAFEPVFPATAAVMASGFSAAMTSIINRDGSCSSCHTAEQTQSSPGRVWIYPAGKDATPAHCVQMGDE